ncbi:MAG: NACHT domain-containing protein, partial [Bacteroidota bacterium]
MSSTLALTATTQVEDHYNTFLQYVEEVSKACQAQQLTSVDKKALRYFILRQLGMLSLHAQASDVRSKSIDKLKELGQSWSGDSHIEEELKSSLLDGLGTISQQSAHNAGRIRAKNILESWLIPLESTSTASTPRVLLSTLDVANLDLTGGISSRKAAAALHRIRILPSVSQLMLQWLSSTPSGTPRDQIAYTDRLRERLSCKLNTFTKRPEVLPALGLLYRRAEELLAQEPSSVVSQLRLQAELKHRYKSPDFRIGEPFLGVLPIPVDKMGCYLEFEKEVEVEGKHQLIGAPVSYQHIFKPGSLKPGEPLKEIRKVLLVGEAGTGKTSLTRKLAYDWAVGTWDQSFNIVYVLPVRALRQDKYEKIGHLQHEILVTAIASECFMGAREQEAYIRLRNRIYASLDRST